MSYIRTFGSFLYSAFLCALFFIAAYWVLLRSIVYADGFFGTLCAFIFILFVFGWLSEKGIILASIPFNWLWDDSLKTRIAAMIPPALIGISCMLSPFRIPNTFTFGDWVITIAWETCALTFYFNMFILPITNPHMGIRDQKRTTKVLPKRNKKP